MKSLISIAPRAPLSWFAAATVLGVGLALPVQAASSKVILISLDGATPRFVDEYLASGAIPANEGLGRLKATGIHARRAITVSPSLTAAGHVAIATGTTPARNGVVANSFHLLASPFTANVSGFGAPIGGYSVDCPAGCVVGTAEPLWVRARAAGKKVITATFPGGDGAVVTIPGRTNSPIIQSPADRTVDFTVPFGAFGGVGAVGHSLTNAFNAAPSEVVDQLIAAGRVSRSPVMLKANLETLASGGATNVIHVAALDTTDDGTANYDTLVFFDTVRGIGPGPFARPSTGPAYVRVADQTSVQFYLEGSSGKAGCSYYVTHLAPDLSRVRIVRYGANFIPRNAAVLADVDDINTQVGFWLPQPDFRIPQRISPGFGPFPDEELEAVYADQVKTFTDYQTAVVLRAMQRVPDADLVLTYFEQPDGSFHQFLLVDPRQPTNPTDPSSILTGQDPARIARYATYRERAYQAANRAVEQVIQQVGVDGTGRPKANVIVVSDHGFAPFHTAVNLSSYLALRGFPTAKVRAVTSGPAVNVYISLAGREPNGIVSRAEYRDLQRQLVLALETLVDTNPRYVRAGETGRVFESVVARPLPPSDEDPSFGRGQNEFIGQDSGDVSAILALGYNFDGVQSPVIQRLGDPAAAQNIVFSVPSFYGAHGYNPNLPEMSSILYAAGPDLGRGALLHLRNIDLAPTVLGLLGVGAAPSIEGRHLGVNPLESQVGFASASPDAGTSLLVSGAAGSNFILQSSPDMRTWTPMGSKIGTNGWVEFTRPTVAQPTHLFYRGGVLP
jgi:hypothetical protein